MSFHIANLTKKMFIFDDEDVGGGVGRNEGDGLCRVGQVNSAGKTAGENGGKTWHEPEENSLKLVTVKTKTLKDAKLHCKTSH